MKYTMTQPCDACPFLKLPHIKRAFTMTRLKEFAANEFPCHKTCKVDDDAEVSEFTANENSVVCAGMLIFNEKRGTPNQMMRICERLGFYDRTKLNMGADVR